MGKVWAPISQVLLIGWVLLYFLVLWEIDWETHAFPIWWSIPYDGNQMRKITHIMGKVWVTIFQIHLILRVLLHFLVLLKIDGETHAFLIWWSIPYDGDRMGKNHLCYGKGMSTNFPGSPHWKGFVTFSHTMRNLWGNPCISHMLKYTIGWESDVKKPPILWEKYEYQFPRLSPYHGFCCNVPWEICGETHSFPIWWYRLIFSCDILYLHNFFNYNAWNRYSRRGAFRTLSNIYDWVFLRR